MKFDYTDEELRELEVTGEEDDQEEETKGRNPFNLRKGGKPRKLPKPGDVKIWPHARHMRASVESGLYRETWPDEKNRLYISMVENRHTVALKYLYAEFIGEFTDPYLCLLPPPPKDDLSLDASVDFPEVGQVVRDAITKQVYTVTKVSRREWEGKGRDYSTAVVELH